MYENSSSSNPQAQNLLSSPHSPQSPDWLLSNKLNDVKYACLILCNEDDPGRDYNWFDVVGYLKTDSDSLYQTCCRLLAEGFDPFAWWEEDEEPQTAVPTAVQVEHRAFSDTEIIELVLRHIVDNRIDITADRKDWLVIGSVIKSNFAEDTARQWYLAVSQIYNGFSERECLTTFRSLRSRGFTGAPLYSICARYGISVKEIVLRARNRF